MKKRTKCLLLIVMILGLISIVTYGYSFAKYVSNSAWNYYLSTKGFYFSSEELGVNEITNVNSNWNYDSTYFNLKNSENDFLISDYDIDYTVKCTILDDASSYSKCLLNGTDSDTFSGTISSSGICINNIDEKDVSSYTENKCKANDYEWKVQESYKNLYFDVVKTSDKELDYVSVLIEVTTTYPYSKTISGEFNLSSASVLEMGLNLSYMEYDNFSRVIITNSYDENKCVKLSLNSNDFRIDENNENISSFSYDDNGNINEIKFNINKKVNLSFIFYKTDFSKEEYDYNAFSLVETNDC